MSTAVMSEAAPGSAPELVLKRFFDAPPGQIFGAWTEPDILAQWMGPKGVDARIDAHDFRVGGRYRFILQGPEKDHVARGVFREIDPPHRLAFTWAWEEGGYADIETEVTIELRANGKGTDLTLTQRRFTSVEMRDDHSDGWTSCLDCLDDILAR